jgi:phenylalanyl-tRNA synthetase alpha chain
VMRRCNGLARDAASPVPTGARSATTRDEKDLSMADTTDLAALETEIGAAIAAAGDEAALEAVRVAALGKKGTVSERMKALGAMSADERKTMGPALNGLKQRVGDALGARREALAAEALALRLRTETVDVTLDPAPAGTTVGRIHPISQVWDEITAIFADLGFRIAEGPDIETDDLNFTKLNFPEGHPARDMHDTFFLPPGPDGTRKVLRTHTSPVQIRTMLAQKPPIRIVAPGRTYRHDSDQTHTPMFHQVEGLVVDRGAHIGHLKWADGIELGVGDDWLEILGSGMVHPNVLRNCGIDPDVHQGFAWGMGIDRIAMLKYGMPDLRAFFEADVRWLTHYGFAPLDRPSLAGGLSR